MKQYTSTQAAQETGKAERTIRQLAEANGIGRKFGHVWVFTDADVARLKALHRGGYKPRKAKAPAAPASIPTAKPTP